MPEFPSPPETSDPLSWIALALVASGIIGAAYWLPRMCSAMQSIHTDTINAFRNECAAERAAHAAAVAGMRSDHEAAHSRIHDRLDKIDTTVTKIAAQHRAA